MSVQVKTPTKNQFEHLEIQCGERNYNNADSASIEGVNKVKDDLSIKNDIKFSQPWNRKRRYSQSYHREESAARRKRLKSSPYFDRQLPTRFLNGGTIEDPLNLNGLESSELGKQLNSVTPQSSPLPVPRRQSVEVRIPVNVTDPLNLTSGGEDGAEVEKLFKKKKQRHNRHKKKDETQSTNLFSPPKNIAKDKNLMEALKIDIEPDVQVDNEEIPFTSKDSVKPRQVNDKIVSPVVRQISPKSKKRRRKSDNKPESSSTASRSLLTSPDTDISPTSRSHKKFKHPKPPQKQQSSKSHSSATKHQPKFIYGNYNRYYGYRNPSMTSDQRLMCLNPDWFDGKIILDIGCNVGHLTLAIARDLHPNKIVGIDIDQKLIGAARKNIRYYMSKDATDLRKFPISNVLNYGPIEAPPVPIREKCVFPHNIMFMQGNYVLECDEMLEMQKEEYDVILALSITKWVHFNWGDDGIKRFFKRVYRQLKPGGRFILEPQPWSSYKKKKKLTDEIFQTFQTIKLRPEQFNDFLLSKEVGFSTCNKLEVPSHSSKGFCRPIMIYTKSDTVQNSPYPEMGDETPIYSNYVSAIPGRLQPLVEVSESSSCSSCDSSLQPTPSSSSSIIDTKLDSNKVSTFSSQEIESAEADIGHEDPLLGDRENESIPSDEKLHHEDESKKTSCEVKEDKKDLKVSELAENEVSPSVEQQQNQEESLKLHNETIEVLKESESDNIDKDSVVEEKVVTDTDEQLYHQDKVIESSSKEIASETKQPDESDEEHKTDEIKTDVKDVDKNSESHITENMEFESTEPCEKENKTD